MEQLLSAGDVCTVLSSKEGKRFVPLAFRTLDNWCNLGIIQPMFQASGPGRHRMFRVLPDVLAVSAGISLRRSGFEFESAANVMKTIVSFNEQQIFDWFKEDRVCLVFFAGSVLPELLRADATREAIEEIKSNNNAIGPTAINLRQLHGNILKAIEILHGAKRDERRKRAAVN